MSDEWMSKLNQFQLAELERETDDYARIRELVTSIAPELVEIAVRLSPAWPASAFGNMLYKLSDALFDEAKERGLYAQPETDAAPSPPRAPRPVPARQTAVYRAFNASGVLLYVGVTNSPHARMRGHEHTSEWWEEMQSVTFEWFDSREEALALENELIETLRPPFNKAGNPDERAMW